MTMRPSFYTLYRRSAYCHPELGHQTGTATVPVSKLEEAERFAAAAVAFAWLHDQQFRRHFWNEICRFPNDPGLSSKATIFVEPHRWADLLVVNPISDLRYVYAVEFKIQAWLANIQNPTRREFTGNDGYGTLFKRDEGGLNVRRRFIVCGWPRELNLKNVRNRRALHVQQRSWENLAADLPRTALAKDLAAFLGGLGIAAFPAAEVAHMKINTNQKELTKAATILREVGRRLDWPRKRARDCWNFYEGKWFFGTELLTATTPETKRLTSLVHPRWSYVSWFGYQGDEGASPALAVWFYCGRASNREKLERTLRRRLKECQIEERPMDAGQFDLMVSACQHHLKSDADWFGAVFAAVGFTLKS
jgi:hypothetical protein